MIIRKGKIKDIEHTSKLAYKLNNSHAKFDPYYKMKNDALTSFKQFHKKSIYSKNSLLLVDEDDNKIIGYAIGKIGLRPPIFKESKSGFISAIYIKKEYRRKRIGKMFFDELIKWFRSKKLKNVELHAHLKNPKGIKAWEKYGFKSFLYVKRLKL